MPETASPQPSLQEAAVFLQQLSEFESRVTPIRVAELLSSNDPPLDAELNAFQLFRVQSTAILSEVMEEFTKAPHQVDHLIRLQKGVKTCVRDIAAVVHPIRRVPTEILHEIFLRCIRIIWWDRPGGCDSILHGHFLKYAVAGELSLFLCRIFGRTLISPFPGTESISRQSNALIKRRYI
ncbi:hypothetical protein CPB85DRAFT_877445 [Mucidula mucida]|nr:hypothetical protein CPB85DRAFT_877445 [Mucidula mucida]